MPEQLTYQMAAANDLASIAALLRKNKLPESDIHTTPITFILALSSENDLIGCIGVEQYNMDGLLRSFAVDKAYRSQKIGKQLFNRLISFSRQAGMETMHLLTTTAETYFLKTGFSVSERTLAPDSIKATSEFSFLCPSSSVYMTKDITADAVCYYNGTQLLKKDTETGSSFWSINGKNLQFTWFEVPPYTNFINHKHDSEQITYVLEGPLYFQIDQEVYTLSGGDSIIVPAGKEHAVWTEVAAAKAVDAWSPVNENYKTF
jgi:amino-acid N-acetyltransferase